MNLFDVYRGLRQLLSERYSSEKYEITRFTRKVIFEWLDWVQEYMQKNAPEDLSGLNFNNKFEAFLGFLYLTKKDDNYSNPNFVFSKTFSVNKNHHIPINIIPTGDSNPYDGLFDPNTKEIKIYVANEYTSIFEAAYKTKDINAIDDPGNFDKPATYSSIQKYLLYLQGVLAHETQHYFQDFHHWEERTSKKDYQMLKKLDMGSPIRQFVYLATPMEIDAQIADAYKIYSHYHKKISFTDALFRVYSGFDSLEKYLDAELLYDHRNIANMFVFFYIITNYIPKRCQKPYIVSLVKKEKPEFKNLCEEVGISYNINTINHNFKNLYSLAQHLTYTQHEEYDDEELLYLYDQFDIDLFSLFTPNDSTINDFLKLYNNFTTQSVSTSTNLTNIPSTLENNNIKTILSTTFNKFNKNNKNTDFFTTLYNTIIPHENSQPTQNNIITSIKQDSQKQPIQLFIFLFIVFFYMKFNSLQPYNKLLQPSIKKYSKQINKINIPTDSTTLFLKLQEIKHLNAKSTKLQQTPKNISNFLFKEN